MSSTNIIRHIVQDIVTKSTEVLKANKTERPTTSIGEKEGIKAQRALTPLPQAKHLFTEIYSYSHSATITETLAAFLVRSVVLDPRNEFRIERDLPRNEVDRLIQVNKIG